MSWRTKGTLEKANQSPCERKVLQGARRSLRQEEPPVAWGAGSCCLLAWGGMWSWPSCSHEAELALQSTSEALAPGPGSRRLASQPGLPAQPCASLLRGPDPGPQQTHCHPAQCLNGAIQGLWDRPLWRALPPPPPGCPWPQPLPVWVGGLAVVRAASSQAKITEGWIVDRGHRNAPHVTGLQGIPPTLCPSPLHLGQLGVQAACA